MVSKIFVSVKIFSFNEFTVLGIVSTRTVSIKFIYGGSKVSQSANPQIVCLISIKPWILFVLSLAQI